MRKLIILLLSALFLMISSLSHAQLDLEQEVLIIPDTHDAEPYKWKTKWFTWGYDVRLEHGPLIAGSDAEFTFSIKAKTAVHDMNVFITDEGLNVFKHLHPESDNGIYKFIFNAPSLGKYRFEFVFNNDKGEWIDLSENVSIKEGAETEVLPEKYKDYSVNVKLVPDKVYADHVVTLIYEISHKGVPVTYPDRMDGADILTASWDESRKEFIYSRSRQNVNGQIAASIVFVRPGRHRVFAEFSHNGVVKVFETDIDVLKEPSQKERGFGFRDQNSFD
ncbi:MAG: hypothetical protein AB1499_12020 [Nitrospirota bacterium]